MPAGDLSGLRIGVLREGTVRTAAVSPAFDAAVAVLEGVGSSCTTVELLTTLS
jgi:hypothetical protein